MNSTIFRYILSILSSWLSSYYHYIIIIVFIAVRYNSICYYHSSDLLSIIVYFYMYLQYILTMVGYIYYPLFAMNILSECLRRSRTWSPRCGDRRKRSIGLCGVLQGRATSRRAPWNVERWWVENPEMLGVGILPPSPPRNGYFMARTSGVSLSLSLSQPLSLSLALSLALSLPLSLSVCLSFFLSFFLFSLSLSLSFSIGA